ncbi:MAG: cation diffusion facilitator family transporter [Clostridiales Family XIII bacterium]|jgi:cation diffusion facilitator family transporter|nr:cation diffusion facilitator family transporter [Clostridiales Family XIII bacterium]
MYNFLLKKFIKNFGDVKSPSVRNRYGKLAGVVGVSSNLLLCSAKIVVGYISGSIAVVADGFNNLADAASSVITLVGFHLAAAPGDRKHPFGHARIEYLTGLFISFIIVLVGVKFFADSFGKILHPEHVNFGYTPVLILAVSILIKIWQSLFFIKCGKAISSVTLIAAGTDSRNDVIATSTVLACMIAEHISGFMIDGYAGCLVAIFIVVSGIKIIRDASDPLLGKAPDPALVQTIRDRICSAELIIGIHDLTVHEYGPGKVFATVHAEIDAHEDFVKCHDIIDRLEREIGGELGISLVIHMDPIDTKDPLTLELKTLIAKLAADLPGVTGIHDLRIVKSYTHSNIVFDVVLSPDCRLSKGELRSVFENELMRVNSTYNAVITFDIDYSERQT